MLKIDRTEVFGTVQWKRHDLCGVAFDEPLCEPQVEQLRSEASRARLTKLSPEERLAIQDWSTGIAR